MTSLGHLHTIDFYFYRTVSGENRLRFLRKTLRSHLAERVNMRQAGKQSLTCMLIRNFKGRGIVAFKFCIAAVAWTFKKVICKIKHCLDHAKWTVIILKVLVM